MNCIIHVAKTKMLISCAVTAQLICVFLFAYASCWFSYALADIIVCLNYEISNLNHVAKEARWVTG